MLQPTLVEIGFTGTRHGMSDIQKQCVTAILSKHQGFFHHGDCIGSDAEAHDIAMALGYQVIVHPPVNLSLRANKSGHRIMPPKAYLERDRDIADACKVLIATPKDAVQAHSGTWYTIKYAASKGKVVFIIMPNGDLYEADKVPGGPKLF